MDGGSNIRLDPDVAESGNINQVPLSDLYGLPVFTEETDHKAGERRKDRQNVFAHIRREIFEVSGCGEDEMLRQIRSQIFQVTQVHIMSEPAEKEAIFSERSLFLGFALAGTLILLLGPRKIRYSGRRKDQAPRRQGSKKNDSDIHGG